MNGFIENMVEGGSVKKYYAIAGMTVAINDGKGMKYLLTDHIGAVVIIGDGHAVFQVQGSDLNQGVVC